MFPGSLMSLWTLRARKLLAGLQGADYRKSLSKGIAPSVEHEEAISQFRFDSIVDVGANKGQFAVFARHTFPAAQIISFEPLENPARLFQSIFESDPKTRLVRAAIGTERGTLSINVAAKDDSSSPLGVSELQARTFGTRIVDTVEVPCGPLSDYLQECDLGVSNLLKIDTQGFELHVLRGAENLLGRFSMIYCELSFVELYNGQALASQVISFLHGHGFNIAGVYNISSGQKTQQLQADVLFVREGADHRPARQ